VFAIGSFLLRGTPRGLAAAYLVLVRRYIHTPSSQRVIEEQTTTTDKTKGTTQMKPQAIKRTTTLAVLTASLLSLSVAGQAAAKEKESKSKKEPAGTSGDAADGVVNDIKIGNRSQFSQTTRKANRDILPMSTGVPILPTQQESTPKKKQSSPARTNQIDLRSKVATMHLHDGPNLVHSGDGVKLTAETRNKKIVGWSATDDKGNKLPTTVEKDSAGKVKGIRISGRPQTLVFKPGRFVIH